MTFVQNNIFCVILSVVVFGCMENERELNSIDNTQDVDMSSASDTAKYVSSSSNKLEYKNFPFDTSSAFQSKYLIYSFFDSINIISVHPDGMCYMFESGNENGNYGGQYIQSYMGYESYFIKNKDSLYFEDVKNCHFEVWGDCPGGYYQKYSLDSSFYIQYNYIAEDAYSGKILQIVDSAHFTIWKINHLEDSGCWSDSLGENLLNMHVINCDTVELDNKSLKITSNGDWIFENVICSKKNYLNMKEAIVDEETCQIYVAYLNEYKDCKRRNLNQILEPIICKYNYHIKYTYCINIESGM